MNRYEGIQNGYKYFDGEDASLTNPGQSGTPIHRPHYRKGAAGAQPDHKADSVERNSLPIGFGAALSPLPSSFAPLLFAGRLPEGIQALSTYGFSAVEISLRKAEDLDIQWLDELLASFGLVVSAFATGRICLEDSLCLCDKNKVVREQLIERLTGIIHLAAHFHSYVIIGGVRGKFSGDALHQSIQYTAAVETIHHLAEIAIAQGVTLLIEPINRYETNFVNTAFEGMKLIETVGQSNVKLLLDTFHMNIEETDPCSSIQQAKAHLEYIHFADSNRRAPGWGHINFTAIMDTLGGIGYKGFITAEILPIPDDRLALHQSGKFFHSLLEYKPKEKNDD